jgi:hypothetical protein
MSTISLQNPPQEYAAVDLGEAVSKAHGVRRRAVIIDAKPKSTWATVEATIDHLDSIEGINSEVFDLDLNGFKLL